MASWPPLTTQIFTWKQCYLVIMYNYCISIDICKIVIIITITKLYRDNYFIISITIIIILSYSCQFNQTNMLWSMCTRIVTQQCSHCSPARWQIIRIPISSNEATWRILEFSIHERSPLVQQLAVNLKNGQQEIKIPDPLQRQHWLSFLICHVDNFAKTRWVDVIQ